MFTPNNPKGTLYAYVFSNDGVSFERYVIGSYNSTDSSVSWPTVSVAPDGSIWALYVDSQSVTNCGTDIFGNTTCDPVANRLLLYHSTDHGQTWQSRARLRLMSDVLNAFTAFFDQLRAIAWMPLLFALLCQLARLAARSRAWRNILAAAYPDERVRWGSVFGAYVAGAGVNAIIPVRGGDLLKLNIVRRRIKGATYATLASSLLVEGISDAVLSGLLLLWALQQHVLPGVEVLHRLHAVDWFWLFRHSRAAAATIAAVLVVGFALGLWAAVRIAAFRARVAQGAAILRRPSRYVRSVVIWQLADWVLRVATIYFFLRALHVTASLDNALRVQVTQSLSTIVPLTPGGIGTGQALVVYVLSGEASRTALLSFSVGMKAITSALTVTLGAIAIALMLRTLHWRHAVEADSAGSGSNDGAS